LIRWRDSLERLKAEGVTLETVEEEALTEDGRRITAHFLCRWIQGRPLYIAVHIADLSEAVHRRQQRQIANALRLPPEKFIFIET
jgi:hypothetical protein